MKCICDLIYIPVPGTPSISRNAHLPPYGRLDMVWEVRDVVMVWEVRDVVVVQEIRDVDMDGRLDMWFGRLEM